MNDLYGDVIRLIAINADFPAVLNLRLVNKRFYTMINIHWVKCIFTDICGAISLYWEDTAIDKLHHVDNNVLLQYYFKDAVKYKCYNVCKYIITRIDCDFKFVCRFNDYIPIKYAIDEWGIPDQIYLADAVLCAFKTLDITHIKYAVETYLPYIFKQNKLITIISRYIWDDVDLLQYTYCNIPVFNLMMKTGHVHNTCSNAFVEFCIRNPELVALWDETMRKYILNSIVFASEENWSALTNILQVDKRYSCYPNTNNAYIWHGGVYYGDQLHIDYQRLKDTKGCLWDICDKFDIYVFNELIDDLDDTNILAAICAGICQQQYAFAHRVIDKYNHRLPNIAGRMFEITDSYHKYPFRGGALIVVDILLRLDKLLVEFIDTPMVFDELYKRAPKRVDAYIEKYGDALFTPFMKEYILS